MALSHQLITPETVWISSKFISLGSEDERPSIIEADESMRSSDIKAALELVFDKQQIFLEEWVRIHGIPKLDNKRGGSRRSNRKS